MRGFERYRDEVWVAELDEFAAAIARAREAPKGSARIEELSWNRLGARLHGAYEQMLSADRRSAGGVPGEVS
jgi:hypothetical protein